MPLGLGLLAGLATVAIVVIFVIALYRLAGIHPTPREVRRQLANLGFFVGVTILLVAVEAFHLAPGLWLYGSVVAIVASFGVRALQRQHHWLVTPTDAERAMLPARRAAMAAVTRQPTFWLLVGALLFALPVLGLGLVLAFR